MNSAERLLRWIRALVAFQLSVIVVFELPKPLMILYLWHHGIPYSTCPLTLWIDGDFAAGRQSQSSHLWLLVHSLLALGTWCMFLRTLIQCDVHALRRNIQPGQGQDLPEWKFGHDRILWAFVVYVMFNCTRLGLLSVQTAFWINFGTCVLLVYHYYANKFHVRGTLHPCGFIVGPLLLGWFEHLLVDGTLANNTVQKSRLIARRFLSIVALLFLIGLPLPVNLMLTWSAARHSQSVPTLGQWLALWALLTQYAAFWYFFLVDLPRRPAFLPDRFVGTDMSKKTV